MCRFETRDMNRLVEPSMVRNLEVVEQVGHTFVDLERTLPGGR